jgi:hypothetical protein
MDGQDAAQPQPKMEDGKWQMANFICVYPCPSVVALNCDS